MARTTAFAIAVLSCAGLLVSGQERSAVRPAAIIEVGPNVLVSGANSDRTHGEVILAADPLRPGGLLACSMIEPTQPTDQSFRTIAYHSADGGRTWRPTLEVETGVEGSADPTCAFGPDGTALFVATELSRGGRGRRAVPLDQSKRDYLLLHRSQDGGKTWLSPQVLGGIDRPWVTVDATNGPRRGTAYVSSLDLQRRTAGGIQLTLRTQALSPDGRLVFDDAIATTATLLSNGAVLGDGTYVIAFGEQADPPIPSARAAAFSERGRPTHMLKATASSDGGLSFSAPTTIAPLTEVHVSSAFTGPFSLAADASAGPFRDRLYATWADMRSGRYEVLLASSDDKGRTWSAPFVVNDDGPPVAWRRGPDHFMPTVRVNAKGVVGILWYDRRDSVDNLGYQARFAVSFDGGESFAPSVVVTEARHSSPPARWRLDAEAWGGGNVVPRRRTTPTLQLTAAGGWWFPGHTAGLAVTGDDEFQALWIENRTGISQVWTAGIRVTGVAQRHGSTDRAALTDVTRHVTVHLAGTELRRADGRLTTTAYLVNTSDTALEVPLRLRLVSLRSDFGHLTALNADNGASGAGAVWDFTHHAEGRTLGPGEKSHARQLEFHLAGEWTPDGQAADYHVTPLVFDLGARVYAQGHPMRTPTGQ